MTGRNDGNDDLPDNINYEQWAKDLSYLLDAIEAVSHDEDAVHALCRQRFSIARAHGLRVEFMGACEVGTA